MSNDRTKAPGTVEELIAILERERLVRNPKFDRSCLLGLGCVTLFFIGPMMSFLCMEGSPTWLVILGVFVMIAWFVSARWTASRTQREAAERLAKFDDIRVVAPILDALSWPEADVQRAAAAALERLLPRMKASDAPIIAENHRKALRSVLRRRSPEPLILPVLAALEQVGDVADIPIVGRLARWRGRGTFGLRVRNAAESCLESLQVRGEREGRVLLRSVGGHDESDLLRPAAGGEPAPPDELLRPSGEDSVCDQ